MTPKAIGFELYTHTVIFTLFCSILGQLLLAILYPTSQKHPEASIYNRLWSTAAGVEPASVDRDLYNAIRTQVSDNTLTLSRSLALSSVNSSSTDDLDTSTRTPMTRHHLSHVTGYSSVAHRFGVHHEAATYPQPAVGPECRANRRGQHATVTAFGRWQVEVAEEFVAQRLDWSNYATSFRVLVVAWRHFPAGLYRRLLFATSAHTE